MSRPAIRSGCPPVPERGAGAARLSGFPCFRPPGATLCYLASVTTVGHDDRACPPWYAVECLVIQPAIRDISPHLQDLKANRRPLLAGYLPDGMPPSPYGAWEAREAV